MTVSVKCNILFPKRLPQPVDVGGTQVTMSNAPIWSSSPPTNSTNVRNYGPNSPSTVSTPGGGAN